MDSFIERYYIRKSESPPHHVCILLNSFLNDTEVHKKTEYESINKSDAKNSEFLNILNTLSKTNFNANKKRFDCFQTTWSGENTTTFILFVLRQRLHSELYARILVNYNTDIICSLIEKLLNGTPDFNQNCTIGIYLFNLVTLFSEKSSEISEMIHNGLLCCLDKKKEEIVLQFILERSLSKLTQFTQFTKTMKEKIRIHFLQTEVNIRTQMLYLDYCDELEKF